MTDHRREYLKEYMRKFRKDHPDRNQAYREAGAANLLRRKGYTILKDGTPVKHGHFIKTDGFSDEMIEWVKCSICKEIVPDYDYKYCPHCGARMDGEEDG